MNLATRLIKETLTFYLSYLKAWQHYITIQLLTADIPDRFTPDSLPIWCPFCKTYVPWVESENHNCPGILEIDGFKVAYETGEPVHDWRYSQEHPQFLGLKAGN